MQQTTLPEGPYALLLQRIEFLQKEVDSNKREADLELERVRIDADADIRGVREKADADNKKALDQIAALEAERTKALKWGVMTLGSAVMGMVYWIIDKVIKGEIR